VSKILGAFLIIAMHAVFPSHLTFLEFVTLIEFGKDNYMWSCSLCLQFSPSPCNLFRLRCRCYPQWRALHLAISW
jgi:hypothetical protein